MFRLAALFTCLLATAPAGQDARPAVATGIDVLESEGFARLRGRKLGLITNQTGCTRDGRRTLEVLRRAKRVELLTLFAPEHGLQGVLDAAVPDRLHAPSGLTIHSLFGRGRKPTPESLRGLDTLVFDIQDIGCRFYTFISTMRLALEAAAEHRLKFFVLDRPNPIGGLLVEGPVLDSGKESFVGCHTIAVRHGMTVGELALMLNAERHIGADLEVVEMKGWRRSESWDATGLTWINPSPNMRSLTEALLYPGIGLLETTNLSVGRGTGTPFEVIGAPWLDGQKLAARLNARSLPGVTFIPIRFTPHSSTFAGESLGGINIMITERARFSPLRTGIHIACALRDLFGDSFSLKNYGHLLGDDRTMAALRKGKPAEAIVASWEGELEAFTRRRERFLLYR